MPTIRRKDTVAYKLDCEAAVSSYKGGRDEKYKREVQRHGR